LEKYLNKLHLISLGCTKNLVDSEVMLGKLQNYELCDDISISDVIVINTCGFIEEAKKESINTILEAHDKRKKNSILVVSGCLTQRYKEELQNDLPEVDIFTGVGDYDKIDEILKRKKSIFSKSVYLIDDEKRVITGSSYHAYIKISEGCNQQCSFCAIPSFKGKLFSRSIESITKEVLALSKKGYYDFTFISQDSSSYGRDIGYKDGLIDLISSIEDIKEVKSARILYLYPTTTTIKLIEKIKLSKVFHSYFDMPLQHISDSLLSVMKRGSNKNKILELLNAMKSKNSFIRTSFIIGHPKESVEDNEELMKFIKEFSFDRITIFKYSDEEGTSSFDMSEKVDNIVAQDRIEEISKEIVNQLGKNLKSKIGHICSVVIERVSQEHQYLMDAKKLIWAPDIDGEILVNDSEIDNLQIGKIYQAIITDVAGDKMMAKILK
jgi:ribosomal protein S12 methylthiotransferase RimO